MSETELPSDVAALTVRLLSAYLVNNTVASEDLAGLIRSTRSALTEEAQAVSAQPEPEAFVPAVSVRKSLASPEHIISLIDGKPYKTLKRHLASRGLTPDEYRSRCGLPASYPMVAPAYAARRRDVAQKTGLGRKPTAAAHENEAAPLVDAALERELPEVAPASGIDEGQPAPASPSRKAPARKTKSKVSGDDAVAQRVQPSEPAIASDIVPDEGAGAGPEGGEKPKPKRIGAPQLKKKSAAKPSPKPARQPKAASATKADDAVATDSPAPEAAASEAAEPSSEPAKASRPKRTARTPEPPVGDA